MRVRVGLVVKLEVDVNVLDDKGYCRLVPEGCWGSDQIIIESARMSTNKGFQGWDHACECTVKPFVERRSTCGTDTVKDPDADCHFCKGTGHVAGDEKLLKYLWTHKHLTPFEMAGATFEIYAPIFVIREWHRHRTFSYNEMSGRYVELPNDVYLPGEERLMAAKQSASNKQSSEGGFSSLDAFRVYETIDAACESSRWAYKQMLEWGVSREVARMVLPVAQYSRFRASGNLRNWLHFLELRLDNAAQFEIREYAKAVGTQLKQIFPRTYALFQSDMSGLSQ